MSIDTRTIRPGEVYIAIAGENHDGHAYAQAARDAGAAWVVIDSPRWAEKLSGRPGVLLVRDAVAALQVWASAYRDALVDAGCKVIAVAGSNGKTSTRHLLHRVLTSCGVAGTQSPKSFNNHLGVPLTLLAADPGNAFVASEIGTNHPGEIDTLARLARPDAALITSIGAEHLEFFGDLDGVAKEEAALLPHVRRGGVVFVERAAAEAIAPYYDVQENVALLPVHPERFADAIPDDFPLPGPHHRSNAALVAAAARWMGLQDAEIREALRSAEPAEGRMQTLRWGDAGSPVTVIHDAYNANPDSMRLALEHLAGLAVERSHKAALLGDMLELGRHAPAAHAEALDRARRVVEADRLWCVGEHFDGATPWSDDLAERIAASLRPGDVLLLKGSRGRRLERILPHLEARFGPPHA
ncbi:MAG: UDP-N-acetylmuramoyl-tripeptide--D-alanyl-D-alanine ligase [Planctomycetota bacterium]